MRIRTFISFVLLLSVQLLGAVELPQKQNGKLLVKINMNSEVMNAVLNMADCAGELRDPKIHLPLTEDAIKTFSAFKTHPAVRGVCSNDKKGWNSEGFNDFAELPLYFADLPDGKRIAPYDNSLLDRVVAEGVPAGDRAAKAVYLDAYWEKVRDFYRKADFPAFLKAHEEIYSSYVAQTAASLPEWDLIGELEDFHARHDFAGFLLAPSPMQLPNGGNFGFSLTGNDGRITAFYLMGIIEDEKDGTYGFRGEWTWLALHEFGHSFSNPVADKFDPQLAAYSYLFPGIAEKANRWGYSSWSDFAGGELITNAVASRIIYRRNGPAAAEAFLKDLEARGYVFIRDYFSLLGDYEADRNKYRTLYDFYPQLLASYAKLGLIYDEKPAGLGIMISSAVPEGLRVDGFRITDAAYRSGIRSGDIIIALKGATLAGKDALSELRSSFDALPPGGAISCSVLRAGKTVDISMEKFTVKMPRIVKLENKYSNVVTHRHIELGLSVVDSETFDGAYVYDVDHAKPGYLAGIRRKDVIKAVNGEPVTSAESYLKFDRNWGSLKDGDAYTVTVERKGARKDLRVVNNAWEDVVLTTEIKPERKGTEHADDK